MALGVLNTFVIYTMCTAVLVAERTHAHTTNNV